MTDQQAKAKLVEIALHQGATSVRFSQDGDRTRCVLYWDNGERWTAWGTTRECIDFHLRSLGSSS